MTNVIIQSLSWFQLMMSFIIHMIVIITILMKGSMIKVRKTIWYKSCHNDDNGNSYHEFLHDFIIGYNISLSDIMKDIMQMIMTVIMQFLSWFQLIHVIMILMVKVYDRKYKGNMKRNMKMITKMTMQLLSYFSLLHAS